jgi:hypothetical protein
MWDRINLHQVLLETGFRGISIVSAGTSQIPGWNTIDLDRRDDGTPYKPFSLYVEAGA